MFQWNYSNYSKFDLDVRDAFPFETPRPGQLETVSQIRHAIDEGYRYIVLEAGTGTGKSAIAATLAGMYESAYILTVTKQLQDQYLRDFPDFKLVMGRSNFSCRDSEDTTCDAGKCVVEAKACKYSLTNPPNDEEHTCRYYFQKLEALNSRVCISNYPYMFLELNYVEDFTRRSLMVCDEAHNLEGLLMSQLTLEFRKSDLKEYIDLDLDEGTIYQLESGDYITWISFIEKVRDNYQNELDKLSSIKNRPNLNEKISHIKQIITDCSRFIMNVYEDPSIWICDYDESSGLLEFKPLKIDNYAKNTFFKYADVCLFMSATILDYRIFAHWLGISEDEIYAIRCRSPFDVKRNPIKTFDDFNLSRSHKRKYAPKTIDAIKLILERHKNDKGIIHTVSMECRDYLMRHLNNPRLISHDTQNRGEIIEKYRSSDEPLVLLSPSVGEGVDLPGDLCRFQIMYKIPYPDLGDRQTRIRADMDSLWYDYKTALALVQTYGRGMRFEDDYCRTYFIDSRLKDFIRRDMATNRFLTESFTSAIDTLPAEISIESDDYFADETYDEKIERKYRLVTRANQFMEDENYEGAIRFYTALLDNELFANDYYPYLKLARAYMADMQYGHAVKTIISFFQSGIYCSSKKLEDFREMLMELSKKGYFDFSEFDMLESEYLSNGAKNKVLSTRPVPTALTIRQNMKKQRNGKSIIYPPEHFKEVLEFDRNMSYDDMVRFKYRLYLHGNRLIEKNRDEAIGFYSALMDHELFENDYHQYRKLVKLYRNKRNFKDAVNVIEKFFKSGIYADKKTLGWFLNQLKDLSDYGNFDWDRVDELKDEYSRNGALNRKLANKPVPRAVKVKKLNQTRRSQANNDDYLKDFFNLKKQVNFK